MADTVLTLSGIGIVPYSSRGITESLSLIDQGRQLRRTVNGALTDLSLTAFRKYRVTLSGSDIQPVAVDGVWPGQAVTVGCVTEIAKALTLTAGAGSVALGRNYVAGSGRAVKANGDEIILTSGCVLSTPYANSYLATVDFSNTSLSGEAFAIYRPTLSCIVTAFTIGRDEWAASTDWTMELEEV
jgi:hypothetical protein